MRSISLFLLLVATLTSCSKQSDTPDAPVAQHEFAIAIHGGAGAQPKGFYTPEQEAAYKAKLTEALQKGYEMLKAGDSAKYVVEAVVNILEDSPLFNAGKGSVITANGKIKMDAAIMDGRTLDAGAVTNVQRIKNPISAARAIMEDSRYILISSAGAEQFAREKGLQMEDPSYFYTLHQIDRWIKTKDSTGYDNPYIDSLRKTMDTTIADNTVEKKFGTVGCVVLDKYGNLCAGTSTGGLINKKYNRIGDSPLIGAGTYANNATCAVSCTGTGEDFIKTSAANTVSNLIEFKGYTVQQATDTLIFKRFIPIKGDGGLIAVDKYGNIAFSYNSDGMFRGYADDKGKMEVFIYEK